MIRPLALVLALAAAPMVLAQSRPQPAAPVAPPFQVVEATIPEMRRAMDEGRLTARALTTHYLARIALYEDRVNAAISVNPHALDEADARDRERQRGQVRGPLHGIPIALKDNIQADGMPTTGGALALAGFVAPYEATVAKNLRDAGAIIIAKTVLTELANWVAGAPTPMPGNYTGVAGHAFNPYDLRRDPRDGSDDGRGVLSPGGSSSGAGTAANFWAANVGTDTSGSVVNPAQLTMLVGIRPTTGRVSRHGIIPITADQDTAGPMARTVTDAAILLGAMESSAPDPADPATARCTPPPGRDYTPFLKRDALQGARIGIPRAYYYERRQLPGEKAPRGGLSAEQAALMRETIAVLTQEGAVIVDPADLPSVVDDTIDGNTIVWDTCSGSDHGRHDDAACSIVFKYGMKRGFNAWLTSLGDKAPFRSLTDLRIWNLTHTRAGAMRYGQSNLDISDEIDLERDKARYEADRAKDLRLAETRGLQAAIDANRLDALLFPGWNASLIGSRPGYPEIVVPNGMVPNTPGARPFPPGFEARPVPSAAAFVGAACSEGKLIGLAYAYEQASMKRVPPPETP